MIIADFMCKVTAHTKARRKTGGGPPPAPISHSSEVVTSIVPAQMKGIDFDLDSDSVAKGSNNLIFTN
jgi:hypothetical protein